MQETATFSLLLLSSLGTSVVNAGLPVRTVKELMDGKGIERPTSAASLDDTFKKAPESKKKHGHQAELKM